MINFKRLLNPKIGQHKCWSKTLHDRHCWWGNCQTPLIARMSRRIRLNNNGDLAWVCDREECQKSADNYDSQYGVAPEEVLRRRTHDGIYPPVIASDKESNT